MTKDQAAEACLSSHEAYETAAERSVPSGPAQVNDRTVDPHWLVLIPSANSNRPGYIECFVGGPCSADLIVGIGGLVDWVVTDKDIDCARNNNG